VNGWQPVGTRPNKAEEALQTSEEIMLTLPEFENDEEMLVWFDTHDTAPYMADMPESSQKFEIIRTQFTTRPLDIRLRSDYFTAIQLVAERQGIPYQRLIQIWLLDKLKQEAPELLSR
jgi:predicted DNA binding CopG/RHH family protein